MVMIILGMVGLILAAILSVVGLIQLNKLKEFEETRTYTVQQLRSLHDRSGSSLLQACEVQGTVECDEPLEAPLSKLPCVIYVHKIVREGEEMYEVTDRLGRREKRTREVQYTMPSEEKRLPFWVRDATGRILVDPQGAELDLKQTLERFERSQSQAIAGSRTLGFRRTEYVLQPGSPCYVLGCAVDRRGQPVLTSPLREHGRFLISYRTEAQITWATSMWALVSLVAAVVFGLTGLVLIGLELL